MKKKIKINYSSHSGQQEATALIKKHKPLFITACWARGVGKTFWACGELVLPFCLSNPGVHVLWVAPFNSTTKTIVDEFLEPLVQKYFDKEQTQKVWDFKRQDKEIHFFNGSKIFLKSAENPEAIISKGYHMIVVDEAAIIKGEVFYKQIMACARKGNPIIALISTPRGKNWFYHYYMRGQDPEMTNYLSMNFPWHKNPDYSPVLKELMNDIPEHIRRQEYYAEFIDDGGVVFKGVNDVLQGDLIHFDSSNQFWERPNYTINQENSYVIGWDLAKEQDYNVITVMDCMTKEIVEYHRENKVPYKEINDKIKRLSDKYNYAEVIYDATGVGAGVGDFLSKHLTVVPFKFTNESKNEIVNKLIMTIENKDIIIPNINTIRQELEAFTFAMTRTGKISYNAPSGMHDDVVMSLALSNFYALETYDPSQLKSIDDIIDMNNAAPRDFYDWMDQDDD